MLVGILIGAGGVLLIELGLYAVIRFVVNINEINVD